MNNANDGTENEKAWYKSLTDWTVKTLLAGLVGFIVYDFKSEVVAMRESLSSVEKTIVSVETELEETKPSVVLKAVQDLDKKVLYKQDIIDLIQMHTELKSPWIAEKSAWEVWKVKQETELISLKHEIESLKLEIEKLK